MLHARQLLLKFGDLVTEFRVLLFQDMTLLHAFTPAVLGVAAVLECAPLLLEAHHLVAGKALEAPVELAHRQRHEVFVVDVSQAATLTALGAANQGSRLDRVHAGRAAVAAVRQEEAVVHVHVGDVGQGSVVHARGLHVGLGGGGGG